MFNTQPMTFKERERDLKFLINHYKEIKNKKRVIGLEGKLAENGVYQAWLKKRIRVLKDDVIVMEDDYILNEHLIKELESFLGAVPESKR